MSLDLRPAAAPASAAEPDGESAPLRLVEPHVTAVLVCHDGHDFLPRALAAIGAQSRPVDELLAVDSGERPADGLAEATGGRVIRLPPSTSFGDAVVAALAAVQGSRLRPSPLPRPDVLAPAAEPTRGHADWLWLLHDDSAPAPDALAALLAAVEIAPSVGIAGCKQVDWDDCQALLDVGTTTSALGARIGGLDRYEVDQGQHDTRSDVLAVSTSGMLVRRSVWDLLGGPDPALAHARDDLDICWRAHLAGHRVIVVPGAVVGHAAATAAGRRDASARSWTRADRRDAMHLRLARVRWFLLPLAVLWTGVVAPLRAAARLVMKQPDAAVDELAATVLVLGRPGRWLRSRRRAAAVRGVPRAAVRRLAAGPRDAFRQRWDAASAWVLGRMPARGAAAAAAPRARSLGAATVVTLAAATAGLLACRRLLGGTGGVTSDVLLPAPPDAGTLWRAARSSWRAVGLGAAAVSDPLDSLLAGLAVPLGSPRVAVLVLLAAALPLSALTAFIAAGAATRSRAVRAWAAMAWAGAPPLLAADLQGRVGAVIAHIGLPLAGLALARAVGAGRARGSITAASAGGLAITAVIAGAPSLAVPLLLGVLGAAVLARTGRWLLAWTVAVPGVLLLPWWIAVAADPRLLLADPSQPVAAGPSAVSPTWLLAGSPVTPAELLGGGGVLGQLVDRLSAIPWLGWLDGHASDVLGVLAGLLAVPALVLAVGGLASRRARAAAPAGLAAVAGLGVAILASRTDVAAVPAGAARGWPGAGLSLLLLGGLTCAVIGLDGAAGRLRARALGWRHVAAALLAFVSVGGPVVGLAAWTWHGYADRDPRPHRQSLDILPAVAAAEAVGPAATRTLALEVGADAVRWSLVRDGAGPRLGPDSAALAVARLDGRIGSTDAGLVVPVVSALLSDTGQDVRPRLVALGIGSVLLRAPLEESAAQALDASPGLERTGTLDGSVLWRVDLDPGAGPGAGSAAGSGVAAAGPTRPSRVRIVAADGRTLAAVPSSGLGVAADVPAGAAGRRLVLAERADPGWRASLDGRDLPAAAPAGGWAQAFMLPARGGRLVVDHVAPGGSRLDVARLGIAALALLVAVPVPRRRRVRPVGPPAASHPVPRTDAVLDREGGPRGAPLGSDEAASRWASADSGSPS